MSSLQYDDWEIGREIGRGAYGKVYELQKKEFDGTIYYSALKVIRLDAFDSLDESATISNNEEFLSEESVAERINDIKKELDLMYRLQGTGNIVNYHDHKILKHEDNSGYDIMIRMELLTPIDRLFSKEESIDEEIVRKIGINICNALESCDRFSIIHRDIKPANIFVNQHGEYKLGDFGIAKIMESGQASEQTRRGTPNYWAPEVPTTVYDKRADIYSLGLVLYWLLNKQRLPFFPKYPEKYSVKDVENAYHRRLRGDDIEPPITGSLPLYTVILKACSFNPNERYQSAAEMKRALEQLVIADSLERISESTPLLKSKKVFHKKVLLIGALVILMLAGTTSIMLFNKPAKVEPEEEIDDVIDTEAIDKESAATEEYQLEESPKIYEEIEALLAEKDTEHARQLMQELLECQVEHSSIYEQIKLDDITDASYRIRTSKDENIDDAITCTVLRFMEGKNNTYKNCAYLIAEYLSDNAEENRLLYLFSMCWLKENEYDPQLKTIQDSLKNKENGERIIKEFNSYY